MQVSCKSHITLMHLQPNSRNIFPICPNEHKRHSPVAFSILPDSFSVLSSIFAMHSSAQLCLMVNGERWISMQSIFWPIIPVFILLCFSVFCFCSRKTPVKLTSILVVFRRKLTEIWRRLRLAVAYPQQANVETVHAPSRSPQPSSWPSHAAFFSHFSLDRKGHKRSSRR